jgi:hypothetical protein
MPFTVSEKLKCVERELRMRYRVYERRVDAGQMSRATADRELALMEDIAADYRSLDEGCTYITTEPPAGAEPAHQVELFGIEPAMSDKICPRCAARYLPARGRCVCEVATGEPPSPRSPTVPGSTARDASPLT